MIIYHAPAKKVTVQLTSDERRNDERQNHEFQKPHEELSRIRNVNDGQRIQVIWSERNRVIMNSKISRLP
jgi:hypothetical protein